MMHTPRLLFAAALALCALLGVSSPATAQMQERLCDTQFENCRDPLLNLIRNERQGIDVAFWFMSDGWYRNELINAWKVNKVPVRVLIDSRANLSHPGNASIILDLKAAGIPMRDKTSGTNLHMKMMLFNGQNIVEFSKANYEPQAFVSVKPGVEWDDEAIYFSTDSALTNAFRTKFDDLWTDTVKFTDYGNITGPLVRKYDVFNIPSWVNFPPSEDFALGTARAIDRINAEKTQIDMLVFRMTDDRYADALIAAKKRGVRVRLIVDLLEYRYVNRLKHAYNLDRMYAAGIEMKQRNHAGLMHEMSIVLHELGEAIFGSSNFSPQSANGQNEHNVFVTPAQNKVLDTGETFYGWFERQFEGKWSNASAFGPFQPQAPTNPTYSSPVDLAAGQPSNVTLTWDGGNWAYVYDIYFGTSPTPPLLVKDIQFPVTSANTGVLEKYTVQNLAPATKYYWRIVGKTMAGVPNSGGTLSFTTAGDAGGSTPYGGTAVTLPGTIPIVNFDQGASTVAYYDTTAGNKGGVYRSTDVDIAQASSGYYVGWTRPGEWLKFTVNVTTGATYTIETMLANVGTGATFRVEVDGVDRTGTMAVPNTGGWDTWQPVVKSGISLTAGPHIVRLVFLTGTTENGGVGNYRTLKFTQGSSSGPTSTPFSGTPVSLPGTVPAVNFDNGGTGVAYYDTTAGNKGGVYRTTDVDIAALTGGGGYYVGWTRAGEWLKYTVSVGTSGISTLDVRLANVGTGGTFKVEVDGIDRTGTVSVPDTGGWETWKTVSVSGLSLTAGQHVLRLVFVAAGTSGGVGNYRDLTLR